MGISHLAIANATAGVDVVAVCDSSKLLGEMIQKYCKIPFESDYGKLIQQPGLQGVVIATPSRLHESMIRQAMDRGIHVFCEKPLTLSSSVSEALAAEADAKDIITQVGYHNRFVATFGEAKRLIDLGVIGRVTHIMGEAYGPVVLKKAAATWRSKAGEGGGCLYDYAAHPINLMNWYMGRPLACLGAVLPNHLSAEVDDAVYATLHFPAGVTGQVSVNWSDESVRKMTTRITIWGDKGRLYVDRQELQLFCGANATPPAGYDRGWTVKYITELTPPVGYYLRGEEYSAQMEAFGAAIDSGQRLRDNDFRSSADTDFTIELIRATARGETMGSAVTAAPPRQAGMFDRLLGRGAR